MNQHNQNWLYLYSIHRIKLQLSQHLTWSRSVQVFHRDLEKTRYRYEFMWMFLIIVLFINMYISTTKPLLMNTWYRMPQSSNVSNKEFFELFQWFEVYFILVYVNIELNWSRSCSHMICFCKLWHLNITILKWSNIIWIININ